MEQRKYAVSFHQTVSRRITVGVEATNHVAAVTAVRTAIDAGTVLDDSDAMPLLHCDPVPPPSPFEADGLVIETAITRDFVADESAIAVRRLRAAIHAAELLVLAYRRAEQGGDGASIDWDDIDIACEQARIATGEASAPPAAVELVASVPGDVDSDQLVVEVPAAELDDRQALTVDLASCGNPDRGQDPMRPVHGVPNRLRHPVSSLAAARSACREYINAFALGGGNWAGGWVRDAAGEVVARVSYNGRVFRARN